MKTSSLGLVGTLVAAGALALSGCISVSETQVSDDPRVKIGFQSDRAARVFYEALSSDVPAKPRTEKRESVSLILINVDKRTVSGPNRVFNQAVGFCDSNGDGEITEHEAAIFAAEWPKHYSQT